jgi:FAD/FMN-containing dehydrogenase
MRPVSSWGRLSAFPHEVVELSDRSRIAADLARCRPGIAYGLGRSYGDVCLNPDGTLWRTAGLDRLIRFDEATGRLACEAGAVLRDIQDVFVPRGWGLPVLPGTRLVTVGGAIANDVHGKNHHETGTFGDHVKSLRLLRTDGHRFVADAVRAGASVVIVERPVMYPWRIPIRPQMTPPVGKSGPSRTSSAASGRKRRASRTRRSTSRRRGSRSSPESAR